MYMKFKTCDTIDYFPITLKLNIEKLSIDTKGSERLFGQSFDNQGFSI